MESDKQEEVPMNSTENTAALFNATSLDDRTIPPTGDRAGHLGNAGGEHGRDPGLAEA